MAKPTTDAAATKKKKSSKDKDVKEKKDKSGARSKEKSESKKKRSSDEATKDKPVKASSAPPTQQQPQQPQQYDADAVQLFRRYDRARTGVLLRSDFLQLLRDYAQPPPSLPPHRFLTPRQPLSLTDSQGIPLGYERSDKNSEFEAGQLFERYDKDHAGTLSMDKFHVFFNDFRVPLRGFVDDLSYAAAHTPSASATSDSTKRDASPDGRESETLKPAAPPTEVAKPVTSVRAAYQATLWELRKLCKDELQGQRDRILHAMEKLRARMASPRQSTHSSVSPRSREDPFAFQPSRLQSQLWDNQIMDRYDALESDSERVDEILRITRRQLRKGMDVTTKEMEVFLDRATELMVDAHELVMKVYDSYGGDSQPPRRETASVRNPTRAKDSQRDRSDDLNEKEKEKIAKPPATPTRSMDELQKTLRVKDQIIYQLLQERTVLRKQKSAVETELHELTELSTQEMRKWAQLTDDMQAEIARLRERMDEVDDR